MADRIESYIDANRNRFIEELKQWMRFPSVSAQRDHDGDTRACAQWLVDHLKGLGFKAELVDIGGQPIVHASKKGMSQRCVMIYGHYDVQPEDPIDQWQTPPFEPTIKDGILYGRGSTDDKGQVFTHVKAVESLLKTEGQLPCEVVFLLEGEEESGGDALGRYVKQTRTKLKPDAIVISDTTMYDEKTPAITYGLRGIVAFEFTPGVTFGILLHAHELAVADCRPILIDRHDHLARCHVIRVIVAREPEMIFLRFAVGPEEPLVLSVAAIGVDKVQSLLR